MGGATYFVTVLDKLNVLLTFFADIFLFLLIFILNKVLEFLFLGISKMSNYKISS